LKTYFGRRVHSVSPALVPVLPNTTEDPAVDPSRITFVHYKARYGQATGSILCI